MCVVEIEYSSSCSYGLFLSVYIYTQYHIQDEILGFHDIIIFFRKYVVYIYSVIGAFSIWVKLNYFFHLNQSNNNDGLRWIKFKKFCYFNEIN